MKLAKPVMAIILLWIAVSVLALPTVLAVPDTVNLLLSDDFNTPDVDADTDKWDLFNAAACIASVRTIVSGNLELAIVSGACAVGIRSVASQTGDFDVEIETSISPVSGAVTWFRLAAFTLAMTGVNHCSAGEGDSFSVGYEDTGGEDVASAFVCVDGVNVGQIGSSALLGEPFEGTVWFRMTRIGTQVTMYYGSDGMAWTQIATFATATFYTDIDINGPLRFAIYVGSGGNAITTASNGIETLEEASAPPLFDVSGLASSGAALLIVVILIGIVAMFIPKVMNKSGGMPGDMSSVQLITLLVGIAVAFFVLILLVFPLLGV